MTAFSTADILLPKLTGEEMTKWSVVACDQYTGERDYWQQTAEIVGNSPSTLKLILPEVFLGDGDEEERVAKINGTMNEYLQSNLFDLHKNCFVLTKRTQAD